jgi:DNA repair protein RecO (recombination protein O)
VTVHKSAILTLRCTDWSETSQVVHLLAREVGRLRCLAKGSRRDRNPFSGPMDRWMLGEAVFSVTSPNRLATLMEVYETDRFDGLHRSLPAYYAAATVTELVVALVPEMDRQPAVFDLAAGTLSRLAAVEVEACRAVAFAFALRLLALLGYGPPTDACVECGRPLPGDRPVDYSVGLGGPVCGGCRPRDKGKIHRLSAKTTEALAFLAAAEWDQVRRVRLKPATAEQVRDLLSATVIELGGKELSAARHV